MPKGHSATNAYVSGERKVIPATLVYLFSGSKVLMIYKSKLDVWNGLGGKLEPDESPAACAKREVFEESGLDVALTAFKPLGSILFPHFFPGQDWLAYVFLADVDRSVAAQPLSVSAEGELAWVEQHQIPSLKTWDGDHLFLPLVLARKSFMATLWFHDKKCIRHELRTL